LAQKLGQLQPSLAVFPQECTGQLASFGANLTPFSLQAMLAGATGSLQAVSAKLEQVHSW
jgi:hypothetical protein